jgi:mannose-6-phosphate isomerase-like protein (cupin superfamily)
VTELRRGARVVEKRWVTRLLPAEMDVFAPDGSEIRVLGAIARGSMAHGTLPPGSVSTAVTHQTVEEMWFVLSGAAELWRSATGHEEIVEVRAGAFITIPLGTHFQFRTVGDEPFRFLMCTMPPWPGEGEAVPVMGHWPPPAGASV